MTHGGVDYGLALALAEQVADGMACLHANNIVHGVRGCRGRGPRAHTPPSGPCTAPSWLPPVGLAHPRLSCSACACMRRHGAAGAWPLHARVLCSITSFHAVTVVG